MRRLVLPTLSFAAAAALTATFVSPAQAQNRDVERFNRQLDRIREQTILRAPEEVPVGQRVFIDYGGYFSFDYLMLEDNRKDTHILRQYDVTGYIRANFDGAHEFFLRARGTYRDFNDSDSFDGRGDELLDPDADRAYYQFDLARYLGAYQGKSIDGNLVIKGGRDFTYWANGLVLGETLDGLTVDLSAGKFDLLLLGGITPVRTVDFDSSRPDFDFNTRRGFYGAMLTADFNTHHPFVYGLLQRDYNKDESLDLGPVTTEFEYNSFYIGIGSQGNITDKLLYAVEVAYEGGETLSNSFVVNPPFLTGVDQTKDDIHAMAADLRLDYLMNDPRRTRASFEMILASGDSDRLNSTNTFGGNRRNTTDRGFNSFSLLNTGLAFAPSVSNIAILRAGISTFPLYDVRGLRRLQVGGDFFLYHKLVQDAPIDEPTQDDRYLGIEPDLFLNWEITSDVTLAVRYGVFFPNAGAFIINDARQFFSASVTFAF